MDREKDFKGESGYISVFLKMAMGSWDPRTWTKEERLSCAIGLSLTFMTAELIGGILANSLAILSDAAHLLTDIAGFGIALAATIMSKRAPSVHYSFGFGRAEILGAGLSILTLWVLTGWLLMEAISRLFLWYFDEMDPVDGRLMSIVAIFGVCINLCLALVFMDEHEGSSFHSHEGHDHDHSHSHSHSHGGDKHAHDVEMAVPGDKKEYTLLLNARDDHGHDHSHGHGHEKEGVYHGTCNSSSSSHDHSHDHHSGTRGGGEQGGAGSLSPAGVPPDAPRDLNMSAALAHVIADLIQSLGVVLAGVLIWYEPKWQVIDPLCTILFAILVLRSTSTLSKQVSNILFEGVPEHISYDDVREGLISVKGVRSVHCMHIWSLSSTSVMLSCHLTVDTTIASPSSVVKEGKKICEGKGISHVTIQTEDVLDGDCPTAGPHVCMD